MPARRVSEREKKMKGTHRKVRRRKEPKVRYLKEVPKVPEWMEDVRVIETYREGCEALIYAGVLTRESAKTVAQWASLHYEVADRWGDSDRVSGSLLTQLRMFAAELGFTPASLSKITDHLNPDDEDSNEFEDLKKVG